MVVMKTEVKIINELKLKLKAKVKIELKIKIKIKIKFLKHIIKIQTNNLP